MGLVSEARDDDPAERRMLDALFCLREPNGREDLAGSAKERDVDAEKDCELFFGGGVGCRDHQQRAMDDEFNSPVRRSTVQ